MDAKQIMQIFADTAFVRMGGSPEELKTARYIQDKCAEMGFAATIEGFEVDMADIQEATLTVDGTTIPCKGYRGAGCAEVEAPLYYLRGDDKHALSGCKGKIVLVDGYLGYWIYQDILENGAVGFITYDGNANYADRDIDQRELRSYVHKGNKLPGVNINAKDAIAPHLRMRPVSRRHSRRGLVGGSTFRRTPIPGPLLRRTRCPDTSPNSTL